MAKILVADDNSNVQKTVALALAELGVEVVAVNNGEAAVRKLADISPDLILADIFMPVRNGYEVCEYREKGSSLFATCRSFCWWARLIPWMNAKRSASAPMEF